MWVGAVAVVVLAGAAIVLKDRIREQWYLYRLEHGDEEERERAAKTLGNMHSLGAVRILVRLAASRLLDKEMCFEHVGRVRRRAIPELMRLAQMPGDEHVREIAIAALPYVGRGASGAAGRLEEMLRDPRENPAVRAAVLDVLCDLLPGREALEIVSEVADSKTFFRGRAGQLLGLELSSEDAPLLRRWMEEGPRDLRGLYAVRIVGLDPTGPDLPGLIVEALIDEHGKEQHEKSGPYYWALLQLGHRAVPAMVAASEHADPNLRRLFFDMLGAMGENARAAIPALERALNDADADVRDAAAEALKKIRDAAGADSPKWRWTPRHGPSARDA